MPAPRSAALSDAVAPPASRLGWRPGIPRRAALLLGLALLAGLAGRVELSSLAVRWAYVPDHFDNVGMGVTAARFGLLKVYSVPVEDNPVLSGQIFKDKDRVFVPYDRRPPRVANYPPLGVLLFWVESHLLGWVDPSLEINTLTSRLVMSAGPVVGELVLAVVLFLLVRLLAGVVPGAMAAALAWCFPPLALDSSFWGQTDSWFLAPALLAVYLMIRQRWAAAGACIALAMLLKPQGVLLLPIALFAVLVLPDDRPVTMGRTLRDRLGRLLAATAGGVALLSLPWTLVDGTAWLRQSYLANLKMYDQTTLSAFNFWYLDALRLDASGSLEALATSTTVAGMSKSAWGALLTLAFLALTTWLCWRRMRSRPALALVLFSGLWLWSSFLWPTGVHERYILYCIPFLLAGAAVMKRLWPAVLVLAVVGAAELTSNVWLPAPAGFFAQTARPIVETQAAGSGQDRRKTDKLLAQLRATIEPYRERTRPWEYLLALSCLAGYGWALIVTFGAAAPRPRIAKPSPRSRGRGRKRHRR